MPELITLTFLQEPKVGVPVLAAVSGPPGIWGPTDPRPTPPIPIYPGGTPNPPGIWGPTDPRPTPPIYLPPGQPGQPPQMPAATADWQFNGDGWFFVYGPFPRPLPLGANSNLDPTKTDWKNLDGNGWTLYSGPYDKPFPIFGAEPPDPVDPPTEPPVEPGCKWHYTSGGWVLICGPYDKPKPPSA